MQYNLCSGSLHNIAVHFHNLFSTYEKKRDFFSAIPPKSSLH